MKDRIFPLTKRSPCSPRHGAGERWNGPLLKLRMFWRITFLPCSAQEPVHAIFVDYLRIRKGTGTSQLFIQARSALTLWTPTSDELDSLIRT
ncbi:hypothetical protein, partial [Caballeronia mineralivorans]|uniref:hypothetical protein n=1 Tax=Caballeronia mineralivorans TaxID=2010198 RepID=UPI002AFFFCBE